MSEPGSVLCEHETQLFVTVPGGKTVVVDLPRDGFAQEKMGVTVAGVLEVVSTRTGIPVTALQLRPLKGIALEDDSVLLLDTVSFEAVLRGGLAGGKGGFGAMLRALAKQNTGTKTMDFGACRDLNGRRLRHVNNDLKLQKWQQARERKEEAKQQGVDLDSDDEKQAMATQSSIAGWHLGVPSWIEHVQQRETKQQRRKLASKRKWEDEESDVTEAGLAVRDVVGGKVTMVDKQRSSFCVVDGDVYVPFTANATEDDWAETLAVGDELNVRAVLKPQGKNKWYGFKAERTKRAKAAKTTAGAAAAGQDQGSKRPSAAGGGGGGGAVAARGTEGGGLGGFANDDAAAGLMASAVTQGFAREKKLKKQARQEARNAQRLVLPVDLSGAKKGLRWQAAGAGGLPAGAGDDDRHWLSPLSGEVEFGGSGVVKGVSEFGSVCVSGVSLQGSGKWYYECELRSSGVMQVGWADHLFSPSSPSNASLTSTGETGKGGEEDGVGDDAHSWAYDGCRQRAWHHGESTEYGLAWAAGDVVGCLLDLDHIQAPASSGGGGGGRGSLSFTLNGKAMPVAFSGISAALAPEASEAVPSSLPPSSSSSSSSAATTDEDAYGAAGGFYPAAALEDGEVLVVKVSKRDMTFGPPEGFKAVGDAMAYPPNHDDDGGETNGDVAPAPHVVDDSGDKAAANSSAPTATSASLVPVAAAAAAAAGTKSASPNSPPAAVPAAAPAAVVVAEALDLRAFGSSEELAALGLDRLKAALMALGVKCGGSLEQRAKRLFGLKGVKASDIDPSLRPLPK
eukprot:CAMPEP_0171907342 /NCGR_PEP_ID=MMETSP0993-20121228/6910_1 /TAXON_ID=483369 /ORGANISM="non described non described, Strain CCMP2098" /LENGTH=792 /DNA_ID=CAMNT_0012539555 /DNA_START=30 /DNA_END=2408 /DNA_ORIENTATION=+